MDTTTLGYPFPEAADAITDYPAVAQSLAEMLDDERTIEGTTIAAIAAAVGGAAQGKRALLRAANGSRMALVYDSVLGKWVGPELTLAPILPESNPMSGSGIGSGVVVATDALGRAESISGLWRDCGLDLQACWVARLGMDFSGATTNRFFTARFYGFHDGAPNPFVNAVAFAQAAIGSAAASPTVHSAGWASAGLTTSWTHLVPAFYFYGTGTGTYAYYAAGAVMRYRWISA